MSNVLLYLQVLAEIVFATGMAIFIYLFCKADQRKAFSDKVRKLSSPGQFVDKGVNTNITVSNNSEYDEDNASEILRIPMGVPLRRKRGRTGLQSKDVLKGGIWTETDSGYMSHATSREMLEPPQESSLSNTIKEIFGTPGGTLALAGCFVVIPPNALTKEHEIEMKCSFNNPEQDTEFCDVTPTIELTPSGLKFQHPVTIVLPSYYDVADSEETVDVTIQSKHGDDDWELCKTVKHDNPKKIIFQVDHFTRFRGIIERICSRLLKKQLYYAGFVKRYKLQQMPKLHVFVWCMCDNLPHTVQQLTAEMSEQYERVVESETLDIRYGQNVNLELAAQSHIGVMPVSYDFGNDELWPQGTSRKKLFHLHKADDDKEDNVTIQFTLKIKARGNDSNSNVREGSGNFNWATPLIPEKNYITVIRDSIIGTLNVKP